MLLIATEVSLKLNLRRRQFVSNFDQSWRFSNVRRLLAAAERREMIISYGVFCAPRRLFAHRKTAVARGGPNMFCPSCGNQAAGDQKFCRSCGMNLQKVSSAVAEHWGESDPDQSQLESAKNLRRVAVRKVFWGMALMFSGIALAILGKSFTHDEQLSGAGALISIMGMFLTGYFSFSASYKIAPAERRSPRAAKSYEAKTTAQLPLEKLADAPPSIAERTTGLLEERAAPQAAGLNQRDELKV
jgi:hypothetical protein